MPSTLPACKVMLVVSTLVTDSLNCNWMIWDNEALVALFAGVIILTVGVIESPVVKLSIVGVKAIPVKVVIPLLNAITYLVFEASGANGLKV